MEQEASQELIHRESHEPLFVAVRGIAPAEGDVAMGEGDEPGVGDGDAMGVGAEIAQDMLRSSVSFRQGCEAYLFESGPAAEGG